MIELAQLSVPWWVELLAGIAVGLGISAGIGAALLLANIDALEHFLQMFNERFLR